MPRRLGNNWSQEERWYLFAGSIPSVSETIEPDGTRYYHPCLNGVAIPDERAGKGYQSRQHALTRAVQLRHRYEKRIQQLVRDLKNVKNRLQK